MSLLELIKMVDQPFSCGLTSYVSGVVTAVAWIAAVAWDLPYAVGVAQGLLHAVGAAKKKGGGRSYRTPDAFPTAGSRLQAWMSISPSHSESLIYRPMALGNVLKLLEP